MEEENEEQSEYTEVKSNILNYFPVVETQANVLNIIEYAEQKIGIDLWPRQKIILKVFYNLPLNEEEKKEIQWLKENKGLIIPENYRFINFKELVLVVGRRGSKSVLVSLIATYEIYKLLNLENPQRYYGLILGTPIYILHCASETDQAKVVQDYIKSYIKADKEFFDKYLEHESEKEIRFKTVFDKNTEVEKGSIRIFSLTSNSSSIPGRTALMVILDEEARFMDTQGRLSGHSVYQALTPSIKNFGSYGKICNMSSPLTNGGLFYDLYEKSQVVESMIAFQYATWDLNPNITRESLQDEFDKNPDFADMEYGANFGEVLDRAFDWDKIANCIVKNKSISYRGERGKQYIITCDAGLRNDRYGIAWGHADIINGNKYIFVDGLKYYEAKVSKDTSGKKIVEDVDIETADNFVIDLVKKLERVGGIFYDQWNSPASIQKMKKIGLNASETTFTNKYKEKLYNDTKNVLGQGRLKVYEKDPQNAAGLFIEEIKHVEREIKGDTIRIRAPLVGPVTSDDLYDCVSNLISILLSEDPKKIVRTIAEKPRVINPSVERRFR